MKKITKLRLADSLLLVITVLILISGIQLEILHGAGRLWVILHIIAGLLFFGFIGWHIYLHYGWKNWFKRFQDQKNVVTKILWWIGIITFVSGVIAIIHWAGGLGHSPIGGIHGKFGFLMIVFAIGHIIKRIKFFKFLF